MVNIDLNYIVHDAKVQLYFYIASDILKNVEKKSATQAFARIADSFVKTRTRILRLSSL